MPLPISQLQSTLLAKQLQYQAALDQAAQQAQQQAYNTMQEGGEFSRRQSQTLAQPIYSMIGAEQQKADTQAREQVRQEQMSREDQERAFGHMMAQEGLGLKRDELGIQQGQYDLAKGHTAFEESQVPLERASREHMNEEDMRASFAMSMRGQADKADSELNAKSRAIAGKYDLALRQAANAYGAAQAGLKTAYTEDQRAAVQAAMQDWKAEYDRLTAEKANELSSMWSSDPLMQKLNPAAPVSPTPTFTMSGEIQPEESAGPTFTPADAARMPPTSQFGRRVQQVRSILPSWLGGASEMSLTVPAQANGPVPGTPAKRDLLKSVLP